jgi:hypothetical protein
MFMRPFCLKNDHDDGNTCPIKEKVCNLDFKKYDK